jgi:MFS family permease
MAKDRLVTSSYCYMLAANFLLSFSFWLLIPVFPFYLGETFHAGKAVIGLVVSCYTISALCIRPFSGYLVDTFSRKPLYILSYFIFAAIFAGYIVASTLTLFIIFRLLQGGAFGMVSVGGNTIVIDIMPSSRRGEGIGYFGLTNNFAMAIGPMVGLFMTQSGISYYYIFLVALTSCAIGMFCGSMVCTPYKPPIKREPLSFDRFLLIKGLPAGISLLLLSIPYGMTTNYVALYAIQIGITAQTGLFFTAMAVGMAISRIFSGKQVDKGKVTQVISFSLYIVILTFFLLAYCSELMHTNHEMGTYLFFLVAFLLGVGFGIMFPAYNTLFINLAPNSRRGTATSTYLTSWDVGISGGMILGGVIAQYSSFANAYLFGAILSIVSTLFFNFYVVPHYKRNKLR